MPATAAASSPTASRDRPGGASPTSVAVGGRASRSSSLTAPGTGLRCVRCLRTRRTAAEGDADGDDEPSESPATEEEASSLPLPANDEKLATEVSDASDAERGYPVGEEGKDDDVVDVDRAEELKQEDMEVGSAHGSDDELEHEEMKLGSACKDEADEAESSGASFFLWVQGNTVSASSSSGEKHHCRTRPLLISLATSI